MRRSAIHLAGRILPPRWSEKSYLRIYLPRWELAPPSIVPQLTIYLDRETQREVEEAARREGCSLSRWARGHLLAAAKRRGWSPGYFDLLGSLTDDTFREPEEIQWSADTERAEM